MNSIALQFSGGKDSLALLFHMEALWPMIDVIHLDTGDSPKASAVKIAEELVPNFIRLKSDSKKWRKEMGDPTSSSWPVCCSANIWLPMHDFIRTHGYRQVLRGAKACDPHVHGVYPGEIIDGVLYSMPIWSWSDEDVVKYVGDDLPEPYRKGAVGMPDCVSCPVPEACGGRTIELWRHDA